MAATYTELFSEIGKAWDINRDDTSNAVIQMDHVKARLAASEMISDSKEQKDIIMELIDVSIQMMSTDGIERVSELVTNGFTPSSGRKRHSDDSETRSVSSNLSVKRSRSMDSSKTTPIRNDSLSRVTWNDVIGQDEAKRALYESCMLSTLLPSTLFVGCRQICTTVLMYGPPGTGKTSLVRAVANESHHYLLELPPSSCLSKWAGEAERRLKSAFSEARLRSPSIIFFDEFDALAMHRETVEDTGARRVLSELLIQFSSISVRDRITIIAATNRLTDLDPAVVRRFEKVIEVSLPTKEERERIISHHLEGIEHELSEEETGYLSEATDGWSGSLLFNLCREACMLPVLEISQSLLSIEPIISTPKITASVDSLLRKEEGEIHIRPVVFSDFVESLSTLHGRSNIENGEKEKK